MNDKNPPASGAPRPDSSPTGQGEGFFSRWSRRKAEGRGASPVDETAARAPAFATPTTAAGPTAAAAAATATATATASTRGPGLEAPSSPAATAAQAEPGAQAQRPLTLEDVEQLDAQSDYRAFTATDVDPQVRNAAMRKLFHSDPHFNVMDGLDVYIDDYSTPQPLPRAIMRTLMQARTLGLIDDELKEQDLPPPDEPAIAQADEQADARADARAGAQPDAQADAAAGDSSVESESLSDGQDAADHEAPLQASDLSAECDQTAESHTSGAVIVPFPGRRGHTDPGPSGAP